MKSVYITSIEPGSGKLLVSLGILNYFLQKNLKTGYFKPIISKTGADQQDIHINMARTYFNLAANYKDLYVTEWQNELCAMGTEGEGELFDSIINKYKALEETNDFTVIEGTDYSSNGTAFEFDINVRLAKNLCAPLVLVVTAERKEISQVVDDALAAIRTLNAHGVETLAVIINKVEDGASAALKIALRSQISKEILLGLIPVLEELQISAPAAISAANNEMQEDLAETIIFSKIPLAINTFNKLINLAELGKQITAAVPSGVTPHMFQYQLEKMARKFKAKIVLPEGSDERILRASARLIDMGIVDLVLLGNINEISAIVNRFRIKLDLNKVTVIDPIGDARFSGYVQALYDLRKNKGLTPELAGKLMTDAAYFGTMMVYKGDVDGMACGAVKTTLQSIKPALQIIKTKPGKLLVSSIFFMCLSGRVIIFADCAINPEPTAEELAEIAISSAETCIRFATEPRIAMISYSSGSSGIGEAVDKVCAATQIVKSQRPDLKIEGPVQYDAAVNPVVGKFKLPGSEVAGRANVLIFSDLNTGNNIYKAVQQETGAMAIGPILQNLKKPVNDLSRGGTVDDLFNTILVTAIQCQDTSF